MSHPRHPARRRLLTPTGLAVLIAALAAGCSPGTGTSPDAGTAATLSGMAFSDLCHGLPGATVSVVGTSVSTTTNATGAFTLEGAPLPATLEVTAPGMTATRTAELDAGTGIEAYAVPTDIVTQVYLLAGETPAPSRGVVEVTFVNDHQLPVAGATVSLVDDAGKDIGAPTYLSTKTLSSGEVVPAFGASATATDPVMGSAIFFGVRPGRYHARVTRTGYQVPDQTVDVVAGSLSLLRFVGQGSDGTAPAKVFGNVVEGPPLPGYGPFAAAGGVKVTLHVAGATDQVATTAADGSFSFDLPDARREADLTFTTTTGTLPTRSVLFCAGSSFHYGAALEDAFWSEEAQAQAAIGSHVDLGKGQVALALLDSVTGTTLKQGVQVTATPPATVFYGPGTPPDPSDPCATGSCQSQSDCASDTWCASDNMCRVDASPMCQLCTTGGCPTGEVADVFSAQTSTGTKTGPCVCLATVPDCTSTDCPAHSACHHFLQYVQGSTPGTGTVRVDTAVCVPDYSPATSTGNHLVVLANLAPGTYTLTADDGRMPVRARVEAGVKVAIDWRPVAFY